MCFSGTQQIWFWPSYVVMELLKTAFLLIPQTNHIHHWKELEETIPTIPITLYCQKMSYVPLEIRRRMFAILHGRYIRNGGICPAYLYCVTLRQCGVGSLHAFVQMVATLGTNEIYWMCHISYWNSISKHSITPFWDFVIFEFDPYLFWPVISRKVNNIARCNLLVLIQKWINLFFYFDS